LFWLESSQAQENSCINLTRASWEILQLRRNRFNEYNV
jgi:sulfur relay (sulfurtransferase) DsrC/TusE family protein